MDPATIRMLALLHRYAENVTDNPGVRKYRRVKLSNSTYNSTIGGRLVGKEMLSKAGWRTDLKRGWLVLDETHTTGAALASEVAAFTAAYEGARERDGGDGNNGGEIMGDIDVNVDGGQPTTAAPAPALTQMGKEEECKGGGEEVPDDLVGCRVLIYGLEKRPELNGVEGIVKEPDKRKGRWAVRVETVSTTTGERSTKLCSLKASCLAVVRSAAAEAEATLLPPPRAVCYWLEGGTQCTPSGNPQDDFAKQAVEWLVKVVQHAHTSPRIKQAGRSLMACYLFTVNLDPFKCWFQILIPKLTAHLMALGAEAQKINADSNLATILTTAALLAVAPYNTAALPEGAATPRHLIRQDRLMPSMAKAPSTNYDRDWKLQPEHIYIHMLLLVATALNPLFGAALKNLVADLGGNRIELHDAPIKSFTRMLNKLVTADDHRYVERKPRPAMNIDVVRLLASATTAHDVIELVKLIAAKFGGLSHLKCLPELAATNPAAADARYHMLPVMVTVVFAPAGLTVGRMLADPAVRADWAKVRANRPSNKVSSEQWELDHDTAVRLLETECDPNEQVSMHCEVQVVTAEIADVRNKMHEVYKVVRAGDCMQLHADVAKPEAEEDIEDVEAVVKRDGGGHALEVAAENGRIATVKRLLAVGGSGGGGGGVNVNWQRENNGATAVYRAASLGHLSVLSTLLHHNANPNLAQTFTGCTPMFMAAQQGHFDVVKLLLEHGADQDTARITDGGTPMLMAAEKGHFDVLKLLLEHGADPNTARITDGGTPIHMPAENGQLDAVKVLLEHSADPNKATTNFGQAPLFSAAHNGHVDVVKVLLEHNADPNKARTTGGATPMYMAAYNGHIAVAKLLLEHGADPNKVETTAGATPIWTAAMQGHIDVAKLLLKQGADLNKGRTTDGVTPTHAAALGGHFDVAKLLLEHNADPNKATPGNGATPMLMAAQQGNVDVAKVLLEHNADPNKATTDGSNLTPLKMAAQQGHTVLTDLLRRHVTSQ